jgi:3-deoxy-D-manno-octulosonic-acid transferase
VIPAGLALYRAATGLLAPAAPAFLAARARRGRESHDRLGERLGHASLPRPAGRLLWLHGASIGEGLSLLPLIDPLRQRGFEILVTTGTRGSATVMGNRLPVGVSHQFAPLDVRGAVRRFLDHWQPQGLLLAESELWPNMIMDSAARGIRIAIVNGRLSQLSCERWRRIPGAAAHLFAGIAPCLAQTRDHAARFVSLGAREVRVGGNLKYDVEPPPADPARLAGLRAASTHPGEEEIVLAAHRTIARIIPGLLTIIVPRDAERGAAIATLANGLTISRRGEGAPLSADTDILVGDTFGEMGLWLRVASLVLIGKTLVDGGGQTPIEAARLGLPILHGSSIGNFAEIFTALDAAGGAVTIDAGSLAQTAAALLRELPRLRAMGRAAALCIETFVGATDRHIEALAPFLGAARMKDI